MWYRLCDRLSSSEDVTNLGLSDGDTCLDIASMDAQNSRKMRDDSKAHHISDDTLFKPRRRVSFLCVSQQQYVVDTFVSSTINLKWTVTYFFGDM